MSALTSLPVVSNASSSGPISRYPANSHDGVPAAVTSLGEAEYVHRYQSFAEQCHLGWLLGSSAGKYPSYISYARALVAITPESYTVIPWEEITEFLHTVGFRASNGEKFAIGPDFTDYGSLYVRLQNEILANVLPKALVAIEEGKEWIFEPFNAPPPGSSLLAALGQPQLAGSLAISTQGIRYKNQCLAWDEVASLYVTKHRHNGALCSTVLSVRKKNSLFAGLNFDFRTVPNSFLLTQLLPYVCPQRLLSSKG
jgi:hypothetical protein